MQLSEDRIKFDADALLDMFASKQAVALGGAATGADGGQKKKPSVVSLLDMKRSQNISIAISQFRMPNEKLVAALLSMDEKVFDAEKLVAFEKCVPTQEEVEMISSFDEPETLGTAEKFVLAVHKIPRLGPRTKTWGYKQTFDARYEELEPPIAAAMKACKQVQSSDKFKDLLALVLAVGNYLNGGSVRGAAYGFKLDALSKLADTKSNDPSLSLLHFLIMQAEKMGDKGPLNVSEELSAAKAASAVVLSQLQADVGQLAGGMRVVEGQVNAFKDTPGDKYKIVMEPWLSKHKALVGKMEEEVKALQANYASLIVLYGEDPKSMPMETFFGLLSKFMQIWDKGRQDLEIQRAKAAKEKEGGKAAGGEKNKSSSKVVAADKEKEKEKEKEVGKKLPSMVTTGPTEGSGESKAGDSKKGVVDGTLAMALRGDMFRKSAGRNSMQMGLSLGDLGAVKLKKAQS